MKTLKTLIIAVLFLMLTNLSFAQGGFSTLSYSVGIPMGDMADFIEPTSWRGVAFDYNYMFNDQWAIGLGIGWQTFYEERGFQTLSDGTVNLSGFVYHYVNAFPAHVTGTYFINGGETFSPYIGLGIGTIYNVTDRDLGIYRFEENQWHFSIRPEIGIQYELNYRTGLRLSAKYNHAFESGDIGSFSHLAIGLGVVWIY